MGSSRPANCPMCSRPVEPKGRLCNVCRALLASRGSKLNAKEKEGLSRALGAAVGESLEMHPCFSKEARQRILKAFLDAVTENLSKD